MLASHAERLCQSDGTHICTHSSYARVRSVAWKTVQASLRAVQADTVDEYRALTIDRLEALLAAVWDKAMTGDITAVATARRIVDAEGRLLGPV